MDQFWFCKSALMCDQKACDDDFDFNILDFDITKSCFLTNKEMETIFRNYNDSFTFTGKAMETWDSKDVLDFITDEISTKCIPFDENTNLLKFSCISGYIFKSLSLDHCKNLANSDFLGGIIYLAKENYINSKRRQTFECSDYLENESTSLDYNSSDPSYESSNHFLFDVPRSKLKTRSSIVKRSEKLWEFLLNLLKDAQTCPELIKWENFSEGTFKFVQSDKVARLWGLRKNNEKMNYEKFSRAMRYYYKTAVLLPVPGKRLVYKFGPHAKGWQNITPIY